MISVVQNGLIYEIKFPYDPVAIDLVKNVPGRMWDSTKKIWTIPADRLGFLIAQFKGTVYESAVVVKSDEDLNVNASIDATAVIPDIDISDLPYRVEEGRYPFKHQLDSLKFYIDRQQRKIGSGFILADQPGAGKTLEVMNIALYNRDKHNSKHCLIICCVNSAKYNWVEDIVKHTNGQEIPYILGSRYKRDKINIRCDTGSAEKLKDLELNRMYGKEQYSELPYFLIVNIETLRMKTGKSYTFTDMIINWINDGKIDLIALDEIHKNTSSSSIQGQQLMRIKKRIKKPIDWIPMTGTPITTRPTDVFLPLRLVDGHLSNSFSDWCRMFCVYGGFSDKEIVGYKNIPYLKSILQPNMLRRLKKDILDLPPKIHYTSYVENSAIQKKMYNNMCQEMDKDKEKIRRNLNPMTSFLKLRQINGSPELVDPSILIDNTYMSKNAKLSKLVDLVDEIVANGEKVVIFSNWVEPLRTLYKFISVRYKTCCYTGTMKPDVREKHKSVFINNPDYHVMLGTVGALGTSHTLTVARNIIFYDEPWNPSDVEQCEDRCHRAGTTGSVNIYSIITKNTVDEVVHNILSKKEGVANYIVDGELDVRNHPELLDILLQSE